MGIFALLFLFPMLLCVWASFRTKSVFKKYSQIATSRQMTGAQVAEKILSINNITDVTVEPVQGFLSDHYDPRTKTLRLSPDVFNGYSMASLGVAAHEVGHAIQHAKAYAPLQWRSALVPVVTFANTTWTYIIFGGMLLGGANAALGFKLAWVGLGVYAVGSLFSLVTLPVEFDASKRALVSLQTGGFVSPEELGGAKKVLDAAALTYVAAAVASLAQLLYYALQLGLLGGGGRDE